MKLSDYGLSARFFVFLLVVITLIVGLVNYYGYRNTRDYLWNTLDSTAQSKLETLARISTHYLQYSERGALQAVQQQVQAEESVVYFLIEDFTAHTTYGRVVPEAKNYKEYQAVITNEQGRRGELVLALSTLPLQQELVSARFSALLTFLFTTLVLGGAIYSYFRTEVLSEVQRAQREEELLREQHGFMRAVIDHSEGMLVVMDLGGTIIHLNQRCAYTLGVSLEGAMGTALARYCTMQCPKGAFGDFVEKLGSGEMGQEMMPATCQSESRNLNDELRHVEWHFNLLTSAQGKPRYLIGTGIDITERRVDEQRLLLARQVIENASEAIIVTDAQGFIEMVNPSFQRISGYSAEEAIGRNPRFMQSGKHDDEFYNKMWHSIREHGFWRGEIWNKRKNGELFPEAITITALKDEGDEISKYVAIFNDITDQKLSEQYLSHLAHHDLLTSLPNRVLFMDLLLNELQRTRRYEDGFGLLYLDLDHFKPINDSHGHEAGDEVLKITAQRMKACVRESDVVARLGGDEFAILLPHLGNAQDLQVVAEKIIKCHARPIPWKGQKLQVGISIGGLIEQRGELDEEALLHLADQLMYASKQKGRNTYTLETERVA